MDIVTEVLEKSLRDSEKYKSINVDKHLEVELDLGGLLAVDNNELNMRLLAEDREKYLLNLTRDNTQLLLNKIWDLPTEREDEVIIAKLPSQKFLLPRSKPVPRAKTLTKWQQFAKEKGIQKKKKSKLSWDDQLKKWIPLYGFKRAAAQKEKDWVLEVPENADPMEDQFTKTTEIKAEKIAKNELQRLRNIAKSKNVKIPRMGLTNPDFSTAKDLQTAVTVARASTASIGKFQNKLPNEKEARGVSAITPGATRKRKLPPVPAQQEKQENLAIVESVLNKRPKIDIEKAVSKQINQQQNEQSSKGNKKQKNKASKNQRKKKGGGGGRKRR